MVLHTPGHTPDSLSLYDPKERTLFVGDTLHENTAVTFPMQGNVQAYMASLDKLLALVYNERNGARLAGGRGVWNVDAGALLGFARGLMVGVLRGTVKGEVKGESRGIKVIEYSKEKMSFFGPDKVFEEGRRAFRFSNPSKL